MIGIPPVCWAVIPVKAPGAGKTRLAGVLSAGARERLVKAMLTRVVEAAQGCDAVQRVCLVGPSDHGLGDRVTLIDDVSDGLNQALRAALRDTALYVGGNLRNPELVSGSTSRQAPDCEQINLAGSWRSETADRTARRTLKQVQGEGAQLRQRLSSPDRIIIAPADLPQIDAADFAMLADVPDDAVAIAPDRHGTGTNALSLPAPALAAFVFQFGHGSFAAHRIEALRLGYKMHVRLSAGLEKDIDEPADLPDAAKCLQGA